METRQEFFINLWSKKRSKPDCPFCGQDRWIGWRDRVRFEQVGIGKVLWPEGMEVAPLTCSGCGFVRLQSLEFEGVEIL